MRVPDKAIRTGTEQVLPWSVECVWFCGCILLACGAGTRAQWGFRWWRPQCSTIPQIGESFTYCVYGIDKFSNRACWCSKLPSHYFTISTITLQFSWLSVEQPIRFWLSFVSTALEISYTWEDNSLIAALPSLHVYSYGLSVVCLTTANKLGSVDCVKITTTSRCCGFLLSKHIQGTLDCSSVWWRWYWVRWGGSVAACDGLSNLTTITSYKLN